MTQIEGIPAGLNPADMGEREFRELADNAPVMIWRSRPDKLCDWFNRPWQDFAGKSQAQLFGYGWAEDVHPDDFDRCVSIYQTAFDAREPFTMPYRLKRHDGVYRWLLDNGAPYYRNGTFAGYFGSCIDITEQRDLEDHQRVLLAELNHRVKNNLQLIIAFLQLSKNQALGDEAKTLLQAAISRVHGVGAVQEELHRNSSGTVDLGDYLPNLTRAIISAESGGTAMLTAQTQSVPVSFQLASNLGLIVNELVINAIKHGNADEVRLQVRRLDETNAEVSLSDAGRGFGDALPETGTSAGDRGQALMAALARRCGARLTRENRDGAQVTLIFPIA
ncbi:sensor histidine kinase [Stutzerimonas azotifigens]|uniref:histidine kinase n=1 Tax=Stutzerimonas azotifigens TaxID=291995 RepID=A0ABR5YX75_9GAMM|nr:histidine kinase dimerization/phosphoacceptor domain -containing protein [Stutzerimonas azotifigens]MBA1272501.1 PAS domain S-box protein [Stutzerimonas azotifigens]